MPDKIKSTFNHGAQGWSMQDGSFAMWDSGDGNPGGCFSWRDSNPGITYFSAPKAYLGDKLDFYGASFSYDVISNRAPAFAFPDVELIGANGVTLVGTTGQAPPSWGHYSIPIKAGYWQVDSLDGVEATKHDIKAVLANLVGLEIRADYNDSDSLEITAIDNVILRQSAHAAQGSPFAHDLGASPVAADHLGWSHLAIV